MCVSKHRPNYKSSHGKWVFGLYVFDSYQSLVVINFQVLDKHDSKHIGSCTNVQKNKNKRMEGKDTRRNYIRIIGSNDRNGGVTEYWSLLTRLDACVDTGGILGMNSSIGTGDTEIYLVQSNTIISKAS